MVVAFPWAFELAGSPHLPTWMLRPMAQNPGTVSITHCSAGTRPGAKSPVEEELFVRLYSDISQNMLSDDIIFVKIG